MATMLLDYRAYKEGAPNRGPLKQIIMIIIITIIINMTIILIIMVTLRISNHSNKSIHQNGQFSN